MRRLRWTSFLRVVPAYAQSTGRRLVGLGVSVTFIAMLKRHAAWSGFI